jgi:hypothetical protein
MGKYRKEGERRKGRGVDGGEEGQKERIKGRIGPHHFSNLIKVTSPVARIYDHYIGQCCFNIEPIS